MIGEIESTTLPSCKCIQMKLKQNNNVETEVLTKTDEDILGRRMC